jgi:DNA protecting protein DprA
MWSEYQVCVVAQTIQQLFSVNLGHPNRFLQCLSPDLSTDQADSSSEMDLSKGSSLKKQEEAVNYWLPIVSWVCFALPSILNKSPASDKKLHNIVSQNGMHRVAEHLAKACVMHGQHGIKILSYSMPSYPPLLRHLHFPPFVLVVRGHPFDADRPMVAVVGSRLVGQETIAISREIGKTLSIHGYGVVSGGAYGVDIATHQGCLEIGHANTAVIVCAGDPIELYPRGNMNTFRDVLMAKGACISEKIWPFQPNRADFPVRNRILSGMSVATILVAAKSKSGSMHTAMHALSQDRDVFVWDSKMAQPSDGNSYLLNDGAIGFQNVDELMERLSPYGNKLPCL